MKKIKVNAILRFVKFLLLIDNFAEVPKVSAEALNVKSYQPWQNYCRGSAKAKFNII